MAAQDNLARMADEEPAASGAAPETVDRPWLWRQGQSGNPAGRPKGAKNKATLLAASMLEGEADVLTRVALDKALAGDGTAQRFFLARLLAAPKHNPVQFELPAATGRPARDAAAAMDALLAAVAAGEIAPRDALPVAALIERRRAAQEAAASEARLEALRARRAAEEAAEAEAASVNGTVFSDQGAGPAEPPRAPREVPPAAPPGASGRERAAARFNSPPAESPAQRALKGAPDFHPTPAPASVLRTVFSDRPAGTPLNPPRERAAAAAIL